MLKRKQPAMGLVEAERQQRVVDYTRHDDDEEDSLSEGGSASEAEEAPARRRRRAPSSPGAADGDGAGGNGRGGDDDGEVKAVEAPEGDSTVKAVRKGGGPRAKFTPNTLTGDKGIERVRKEFPKLKFKGAGHEVSDLQLLMRHYRQWAFNMFPNEGFMRMLQRIEKFGATRKVQSTVEMYRSGGVPDQAMHVSVQDVSSPRAASPEPAHAASAPSSSAVAPAAGAPSATIAPSSSSSSAYFDDFDDFLDVDPDALRDMTRAAPSIVATPAPAPKPSQPVIATASSSSSRSTVVPAATPAGSSFAIAAKIAAENRARQMERARAGSGPAAMAALSAAH